MRAITRLRVHLPTFVVWTSLLACGDEARHGSPAAPSEAEHASPAVSSRPVSEVPRPEPASRPAPEDDSKSRLDFPMAMPAARSVTLSHRVSNEDGTEAYTLNYEAEAGADEIDDVAASVQASFEADGLTVERSEFRGPQGTMITLKAKAGTVEATATLSTTEHDPELRVVAGWRGPTRN